MFEGPLDLLLHLIKKNRLNITDIPIALITEQYLEYLKLMKVLNLDIAGEYLLMAATLLHIKSKMLLPASSEGEGRRGRKPTRGRNWCGGSWSTSSTRRQHSNWKTAFVGPGCLHPARVPGDRGDGRGGKSRGEPL